jgi:hypothetical protein
MLNVPAHWRIKPSFAELSPFGAGEFRRSLRIVVETDTLPSGPELDLLAQLSGRPGVETFATGGTIQGRIELGPEDVQRDALEVTYVHPSGTTRCVLAAARSLRSNARLMAAEYGLDEQETWRGLALAQAGRRHQLDAVVSAASVLEMPRWEANARAARVVTLRQACALLGLFLRAHNDFTVLVDGNHAQFLRFEQFYRGAGIAALPDYFDWLTAAWAMREQGGDSTPLALLRAVDARIGRALVARDYINVRVRHWRPDETWDEVLYFFESLLLSLSGALDAFARLLDAAFGLSRARGGLGFRNPSWRDKLARDEPKMIDLLADGSHFRAVVDLVAILRNFVHGEVLSSELLGDGDEPDIDYGLGVLALDKDTGYKLRAAAAHAGGAAVWGIEQGFEEAVTVMPITFQGAAVSHVLIALREAMATGVLPARAPEPTRPLERSYWLPTDRYASSLRLLAGLTDGSRDLGAR